MGYKKTLFALMVLSIIFLVGCQPAAEAPEPAVKVSTGDELPQPAAEPKTAPAEPKAAPTPAPLENIPETPSEGVDIERICDKLLTDEEASSMCGTTVQLTSQDTEQGCWVNLGQRGNTKLTGGFTTRDWQKEDEATEEFERGVSMRRTQGAVEGKAVGERSYEYDEIGRHNVVWLRGTLLTRLGAMNELCPADKLIGIAQLIDSRMK